MLSRLRAPTLTTSSSTYAALAAGRYRVGREEIISAITLFHHQESMDIELMPVLIPGDASRVQKG
jgi:hypothetical protein